MRRISPRLSAVVGLVALLLAFRAGISLPVSPAISRAQEVGSTADNQIVVQTTGSRLCTNLVLQETSGAAGAPITLQVLPLVAGGGGSAQPLLSLAGCDDPQATDRVTVSLPANGWQAVYIQATLGQVATYSGKLVVQPQDAAAILTTLEATRLPRELQLSPLQDGKVSGSTLLARIRQPLRMGLKAGQAPIGDLRYEASLLRRDGGVPVNGAPQAWLEQSGARVTGPLTVTAEMPLSLELVAELPDAADYAGALTLHFDGEEKSVDVAFRRGATQISLSGPGMDGKGLTLNTKLGEFQQTLHSALPAGTDPVARLRYAAQLARSDGAPGREMPVLRLLAGGVDLNEAEVFLAPGAEPVEWTLSGSLPEVTAYAGWLRLDLGEGRTQEIPVALTRHSFEPGEGLTMPAPAPARWQTKPSPIPGWPGAQVAVQFTLEEKAGQAVQLEAPRLVKLVQVQEDGSVVNSWLGRKPVALQPAEAFALPANGSHTVKLEIGQLYAAGKYQATVRLDAPDGREIETTADILVRHFPLPALLMLILGILVAWLLQFWAGGGRQQAVARWKLATVQERIKKGLAGVVGLPDWVEPHAAHHAWQALQQRLVEKGAVARLARSAADLSTVAEDGEVRAGYLEQALGLVPGFESEMEQAGLSDPARQDLQNQVHVWLAHEGMLYDRLARLESTAAVQDADNGAPAILNQMRQRLVLLQGQPLLTALAELQQKLEQLQIQYDADPALQPLAEQAKAAVATHLTKGVAVQVRAGDLEGASQSLRQGRAEYARLLVEGMDAQLAALQASSPAGGAPGPAWQAALLSIGQAQALLAPVLPGGSADDRLRAAEAARLPFTQAQARVARAQLETTPLDLQPAEWQALAGHGPLTAALEQAYTALAQAEAAGSPGAAAPHLAAGQHHYEQARQEWLKLQWDLLVYRLERLAENAPGQLPLGVAPDDADWAQVRALAAIERDRLPERQALAQAALVQASAWTLGPLLKRLELAAAQAAGACPFPAPVAEFKRLVAKADARHTRLLQALGAQPSGPAGLLSEAERAYEEAYSAYGLLVDACRATKAHAAAPPPAALSTPEAGMRALTFGMPWQAGQADLTEIPPLRRAAELAKELFAGPKLIRFLIGSVDGISLAVAFAVAVLVGLVTKVADQPTFGTFGDYITVALWGFGAGELSQYLTKATYSEVMKRVQGQ